MQGASAGNPGYLLYRKHNNSGLLVPFAEVKLLLIKGVTEPIVSKYGIQGEHRKSKLSVLYVRKRY